MRLIALYLTKLFLARFLLILAGFTVFILAVDLLENAEEAIEKTGGEVTGALYYAALRIPEVVSDFIHIAGLLAGLLTLTQLLRNSELTAIWNAGVSQFGMVRRLMPGSDYPRRPAVSGRRPPGARYIDRALRSQDRRLQAIPKSAFQHGPQRGLAADRQ